MSPKRTEETTPPEHPFRSARRAAVPLLAIETADPSATIVDCIRALPELKGKPVPLLVWDAIIGLRPVVTGNKEVKAASEEIASGVGDPSETLNFCDCFSRVFIKYNPGDEERGAVFFCHAGHVQLEEWTAVQAIWNLRDKFKSIAATLVLLGPAFKVPGTLKHDLVVISEPLPREKELEEIAKDVTKGAVAEADWVKVVDTLRGLSAFAAEQVTAMAVRPGKNGSGATLDYSSLWERKRKMIEQTPGLSVWRGGEAFDQIGGCESVKAYLRDYMAGPARMRAVVWIDEIEKALGGAAGDMSGVSQDQLGQLLTYMQDSGARGLIFVGPPGAAKSAIAKATGNEANVPTIALDLGGMKGALVGQSEMQLRGALQVIDAISDGKALWIATCNSLAILPPELKRRFALGTWFFDLPDRKERAAIWKIYAAQYDVEQDIDSDELPGWTGAEIKALFDTAWSTGRSLRRASKIIVPVSKSAPEKIEELRRTAAGKFTSAGKEGIYEKPEAESIVSTGRKMELA